MKILKVILIIYLILMSNFSYSVTLSEVVAANRVSTVYLSVQKAVETTGAITEVSGTGFVLNKQGFVLTAAHVVSGGVGLQVQIRGAVGSREGNLENMEILYENSNFDVAVLRFKNTSTSRKAVSIGDPWRVADDASVYAMGYPGIEEWFHTEGKLSGKGPKGSWNTTITLNPGMSGGPIFNIDGKVIAMVWGGVATTGITGINRVIPINLLAEALNIAGIASPVQISQITPSTQLIELPYKFDQTQNSLNEFKSASKSYTKTFQAQPGFKITDYKFVAKSANNASQPTITLDETGKNLVLTFSLTSGPVYDQWRGWLDGEILTRQVKE